MDFSNIRNIRNRKISLAPVKCNLLAIAREFYNSHPFRRFSFGEAGRSQTGIRHVLVTTTYIDQASIDITTLGTSVAVN